MCRIASLLRLSGVRSSELERHAAAMVSVIARSGPDDSGVWCDLEAGLALSHRRLSILDLSPAHHQPMLSVGGCYVIAFNGEIYNHLDFHQEPQHARLSHAP